MNDHSWTSADGGRPTAVVIDLENLLHDSRGGGTAATAHHLQAAWSAISAGRRVTWAVGAGDYWLTAQTLRTTAALGVRVRPNRIGPNMADRTLLTRGADMPGSVTAAVIVSGDSDLLPLVRRLQLRGVHVTVAASPRCASRLLVAAADEFLPLATWDMLAPHMSPAAEDHALAA